MAHNAVFIAERESQFSEGFSKNESHSSSVSWAAVIAGAFVAAALSLILLALGTGIGLSSVSPWGNAGAPAGAVSRGAILWLIAMEMIASAIGGYLAGRLRTKWVNVHTDEVYFRDTAHGFLVWAVSVVIAGAFLASAGAYMAGASARTTDAQADGRALDANAYFVDGLLRVNPPMPVDASERAEVEGIFAAALRHRDLSAADRTYLSEMVAAKTGITGDEAQQRVTDIMTQVQQNADAARKAAAHSLYWLFLALLMGAFCASFAATIGGRQRDRIRAV